MHLAAVIFRQLERVEGNPLQCNRVFDHLKYPCGIHRIADRPVKRNILWNLQIIYRIFQTSAHLLIFVGDGKQLLNIIEPDRSFSKGLHTEKPHIF